MSTRNQNDDLFQESRMSFGEHLEELRVVLIRSLAGVAVGCVFGFLFAEKVVHILQGPLENALTAFYVNEGKEKLREEHGYLAPEYSNLLEDQEKIPERLLVDPGDLVAALRSVSPDFLNNISLKPYRFNDGQFDTGNVLELCKRWSSLQAEDDDQRSRLQLLWNLLDAEQQLFLQSLSQKNEVSNADLQQFVRILNFLLTKREINESPEFEPVINNTNKSITDVLQSDKENALLEMKQQLGLEFDPDLSQRLNRLLIAEAFGDAVTDVQLDMVPITVWKSARFQSQSLGATETFMIWLKAGIVTGLVFASPWVFFQIWSFVAAGLYPTEQRYVYFFLPISLTLFFSGVFLAFFFVFEPVLDFLFSFNARMGISPQPRINDWLSFVMFLPLGFGIAFQLPLVMLFINRIELVSVEAFTSSWRVAVVAIFGLSMLLTPADPVSMIMLAIPLTGLYFLGIFLCKKLNKPSASAYANPQNV